MTGKDEWLIGMMLAQEKHSEPSISEQVDAIRRRPSAPLPVPVQEKEGELQPYGSRAEAGAELAGALWQVAIVIAPPVVSIVAIGGILWIGWAFAVASAEAVALAAKTWIAAHTGAVVAGVAALAAGAIVWVTSLGGKENSASNPPPPGGSGWEFYQEQRQGWRKT